jgi:hypothetical protein
VSLRTVHLHFANADSQIVVLHGARARSPVRVARRHFRVVMSKAALCLTRTAPRGALGKWWMA